MLRAKSTAVIFVFTGWASMTAMAMEPQCATTEDDRCERWAVELPEALTHRSSFPVDVLLHPSESSVVAVGYARSESDPFQAGARGWVTSLDAETGGVLTHTVLEPASYVTIADAAMSPSGDRVVVVGKVSESFLATPFLYVAALGTADGSVIWQWVLPAESVGRQVAISADGLAVATGFVVGEGGRQLVALAFRPDGSLRWHATWSGPGGNDIPEGLVITPDGRRAVVAVASNGTGSEYDRDIATVAFAVRATGPHGRVVWQARYDFSGVGAQDAPRAIALSPDGAVVYVTGYSNATTSGPPFAVDYDTVTLAYETWRGDHLWTSRFRPPGSTFAPPRGLAATSSRVVLTMTAPELEGEGLDIVTVGLDALTGTTVWSSRASTPLHDLEVPNALTATAGGGAMVLTGISSSSDTRLLYAGQGQNGDQVTLAYDPGTGERLWAARFRASEVDKDTGRAVAVASDGSVFTVTALRRNVNLEQDFDDVAVVAY